MAHADSDHVLSESLDCLKAHLHPEWGDRTPMDVFNRLLAKHDRPPEWTKNTHLTVTPEQIKSRQEHWSLEQLSKLRLGHGDPRGQDFDCPIIVAEYAGELRLLDGNHRINRWKIAGDKNMHLVHIHVVSGPCDYVELPSAA